MTKKTGAILSTGMAGLIVETQCCDWKARKKVLL